MITFVAFAIPMGHAAAQEGNITLSRFRVQAVDGGDCPASLVDGSTRAFCGDEAPFRTLMSQFGTAMVQPLMNPARTLGWNGVYVGFETQVTSIDGGEDYWERGVRGQSINASQGDPGQTLTWSRINVRKGFPFGVELGFNVGHAYSTSYFAYGFSAQIAPFEGFRSGWGWVPDFAVRASVQVLAGDREFSLTVPSLDFILSKPLVISRAVRFTPIIGGQLFWVVADSEVLDLTPNIDAYAECMPDPGAPEVGEEGTLRCTGSTDDFNNNVVFEAVRSRKFRLSLGAQIQYESFVFSTMFNLDLGNASDNVGDPSSQWSLAFGAGLAY